MGSRLAAVLLLAALAPAGAGGGDAPLVRVERGSALLAEDGGVRPVDRRAGAQPLRGEAGRIQAGAETEVALAWRGRASATVTGPAAFELRRRPGLELASFQVLEVEVRRGPLVLGLPELGVLELRDGVLRARALPGGVIELLNRGGTPLELRPAGGESVWIAAGQRLRSRGRGP